MIQDEITILSVGMLASEPPIIVAYEYKALSSFRFEYGKLTMTIDSPSRTNAYMSWVVGGIIGLGGIASTVGYILENRV